MICSPVIGHGVVHGIIIIGIWRCRCSSIWMLFALDSLSILVFHPLLTSHLVTGTPVRCRFECLFCPTFGGVVEDRDDGNDRNLQERVTVVTVENPL